jgi:hypothetical protein
VSDFSVESGLTRGDGELCGYTIMTLFRADLAEL